MNSSPEISVVIPTHKRADTLKQCLDHLEKQSIADKLQVIVVSDGHDEKTSQLFTKHSWNMAVEFMEIPKAQQGVARNRGLEKAKAHTCLLIGDDIFLQPDACEAHLVIHSVGSSNEYAHHSTVAVLGYTTWDPKLEISPVMQWLEKSGWQFGYPMLRPYAMKFIPKAMQHRFSYTSHISLPTDIAKDVPFLEDVSLYGWEDIEWGIRLRDAGIRLFYNDTAKAYHHHHMTLDQSLERMHTLGKSIVHISSKVGSMDRMPPWWKRLILHMLIMSNPRSLTSKHRRAFLQGIADAKRAE
jgi:glycosyltransferase involved in cell wall biosynthesis